MPLTANQLALGANYQLEAYAEGAPVDQVKIGTGPQAVP